MKPPYTQKVDGRRREKIHHIYIHQLHTRTFLSVGKKTNNKLTTKLPHKRSEESTNRFPTLSREKKVEKETREKKKYSYT
jgi:hypothetical protein